MQRGFARALVLAVAVFLSTGGLANAGKASDEAWAVAARSLLINTATVPDGPGSLFTRSYLLAGRNQFHSIWARDFSFSVGGALALGQTKTVRDSLEALLSFQRDDGLISRGLDNLDVSARVILGILGIVPAFETPLKPWFVTEYDVIVLDSNLLVPWAASRYIAATHDLEFARKWLPAAERAFQFLEGGYLVGELVGHQPPYSDWEDSVQRRGRVAFTNELYILALRGVSQWCELLGDTAKSRLYAERAERVARAFFEFFWDPVHKMIRNFEGDEHLSADANLFAVVHGLVPDEAARQIMETLRGSPLWAPMPGRATWPNFPDSMKGTNVKLVGIAGYHDKFYWLWITAAAAMAERAQKHCDAYHRIMDALSERIAHDGTVYEVFDLKKSGRLVPVWRPLYRAENPLTWSAAMYLEAAASGCR